MPTGDPNPLRDVFATAAARVLAQHPADEQRRMLSAPGLAAEGSFYGFVSGDALTVKLPADRVQELVADGRGLPCSPRPGRPMREWVQIPASDVAACTDWLLEARAFVTGAAATGAPGASRDPRHARNRRSPIVTDG
ncbi:hypothetical protein [Candidatus Blastococcus massiliensis]|uniref:hypothetical protein n=1 Tax=Candidatus Blastococcus massiliensis TaxID=1470358 RepID=UPI0004B2721F|nr:hypothetical protein [Candidatus Blastococcus massiliensis]